MKNITAMIITFAMLCAVSCGSNINETTLTTDGTSVSVVNTGGASPFTTETEETPETAETNKQAIESTEVSITEESDPEELLVGYTVYDVTAETYLSPLDNTDIPEKIALRFTDLDDLLFFVDYTLSEYNVYCYYVTRVYSKGVNIHVPSEQFEYSYIGFGIKSINGTIFIKYSNGNGTYGQYYIIRDNDYYLLENAPSKTGHVLHVCMDDDGELTYQKTAHKYYVFDFEAFLMAYESDDDFYEEIGSVIFENGEAVFVPNEVKTIGDGHIWSDTVDRFCEEYGVDSAKELAKLYKQYAAEGKQREFMELDELKKG